MALRGPWHLLPGTSRGHSFDDDDGRSRAPLGCWFWANCSPAWICWRSSRRTAIADWTAMDWSQEARLGVWAGTWGLLRTEAGLGVRGRTGELSAAPTFLLSPVKMSSHRGGGNRAGPLPRAPSSHSGETPLAVCMRHRPEEARRCQVSDSSCAWATWWKLDTSGDWVSAGRPCSLNWESLDGRTLPTRSQKRGSQGQRFCC